MSTPKLAIAMNYIDDDLVSGAVEYKRTKKKNSWLKWGAMAACLCLVVALAIPMLNNDSPEPMAQDEGHVIAYDFEPLTFYSFDSLTASIEEMRGNATEDIHNLGGIEHLYIPAAASLQELMLDAITVKERYVCIYYYLEELDFSKFETADEEEIARISNTVKLEWTRNEDGSALLANTVEQLSLTELFDGMYYYDITYPTQPDTVLARSFFWVHDGYMFNLDIPDELYMTIPAQASISSLAEWDFTELERIDLT